MDEQRGQVWSGCAQEKGLGSALLGIYIHNCKVFSTTASAAEAGGKRHLGRVQTLPAYL